MGKVRAGPSLHVVRRLLVNTGARTVCLKYDLKKIILQISISVVCHIFMCQFHSCTYAAPALSCSEQFTTKLVKLHNLQSLFASIHPVEVKDHGRHLQLCRNRIRRPSPNRSQLTTSPTSLMMSSDEILHFDLASSQILLIVLFLHLKIGLSSAVPPVLRHSD